MSIFYTTNDQAEILPVDMGIDVDALLERPTFSEEMMAMLIDDDLMNDLSSSTPSSNTAARLTFFPQVIEQPLPPLSLSRQITAHSLGEKICETCNTIVGLYHQAIFDSEATQEKKKHLYKTLNDATRFLKQLSAHQAKDFIFKALMEAEQAYDQDFILVPHPVL